MSKYNVALFDMDGVIVDSRPVMELSWRNSTIPLGLSIPFDSYLTYVGLPFSSILQNLEIPQKYWPSITSEYRRTSLIHADSVKLYKCIRYVFRKLRDSNLRIGVVTSKEFVRADILLDHFKLPIDILVTPEMSLRGKPSPDPLLKALSLLDIQNTSQAFYVGDMLSDYHAACAANIDFLFAAWGYGNSFNSGYTLSNIVDLLEFIGI